MNLEWDKYRRDQLSVPSFAVYLRTSLGGILLVENKNYDLGVTIGSSMGGDLPSGYDEIYDEASDILVDIRENLDKMFDPEVADGVQENSDLRQQKEPTEESKTFKLDNSDRFLSKLWSVEPLLGREVFVKIGYIGLPYYYYVEVFRGIVKKVKTSKGYLHITARKRI